MIFYFYLFILAVFRNISRCLRSLNVVPNRLSYTATYVVPKLSKFQCDRNYLQLVCIQEFFLDFDLRRFEWFRASFRLWVLFLIGFHILRRMLCRSFQNFSSTEIISNCVASTCFGDLIFGVSKTNVVCFVRKVSRLVLKKKR